MLNLIAKKPPYHQIKLTICEKSLSARMSVMETLQESRLRAYL